MDIEKKLSKLQSLIGAGNCEVVVDNNVPDGRTVWTLWSGESAVGQIQASDEGYSAYLEGHNWTDACSTVEACAKQLKSRAYF